MERLLTPAEAAEVFRVSTVTLRWWRRIGRRPTAIQIGPGTYRSSPEDLSAYIAEHTVSQQ